MPNTATITFSPGELEVHVVALAHQARERRSRWRPCRARRSPAAAGRRRTRRARRPAARRARRGPATLAHRRARGGERRAASRPAARCPLTAARRRAASSEPLSSELGLVDSTSVTQRSTTCVVEQVAVPEVDHRRLGEAADDLVGARDDEVGAQRQRVPRQVVVEGEVRAPRLVDDQRHAVRVRHLGQRGHVGHRAEVGGRDDRGARRRRASRPARGRARRASGSARCAARGRARAPRRSAAARTGRARRSVLEWALRWTTTSRPRWASASSATWLPCEAPLTRNQVRLAPQASAASACACCERASARRPRRCRT